MHGRGILEGDWGGSAAFFLGAFQRRNLKSKKSRLYIDYD